jgi:hypothetical protein
LKAGANSGNVEMLHFLLEKGGYPMEINGGSWKGERLDAEQRHNVQEALLYATDAPALRILLSYLAQPNKTGDFGPIDLPQDIKEHSMDVFKLYQQTRYVQTAVECCIQLTDLTTLQYEGSTIPKTEYINNLLHEASKEGSLDCVKFILTIPGADINAPNLKKVGHLYRAAIDQRLDVVRYMLENEEYKPDLHQANRLYTNGATALFGAVMGGNADIVKLILKYGGPLESPVDKAILSKESKRVVVRAAQTYRAPVTIEFGSLKKEEGSRSIEVDLDEDDGDWLAAVQIRKSDLELKESDVGGRELKVQVQG